MGRKYYNDYWRPYVSVGERRRQGTQLIAKMKKAGQKVQPVEISGTKIATTFWGNAWCKNLEAYSDYSNRLPRGRAYVRNGSVIDLQIEAGHIHALVSGSDIYEVDIKIKPLDQKRWTDIKRRCAGRIDSLVELLQGAISKGVMEIVSLKNEGLFPSPKEISLSCSCPDWATMCKHVAATLYGVGARLDHAPELLFVLRGVDPTEMVQAAVDQPRTERASKGKRTLKTDELSSIFGVEIDLRDAPAAKKPTAKKKPVAKKPVAKKPVAKKPVAKKPAAKKPAAKKPVAKKPVAKKPVAKKPVAKKPAAKKPAAKKPVAKKPVAKKPVAKKNEVKKPVAKNPAVKKKTAKKKASKENVSREPRQ